MEDVCTSSDIVLESEEVPECCEFDPLGSGARIDENAGLIVALVSRTWQQWYSGKASSGGRCEVRMRAMLR